MRGRSKGTTTAALDKSPPVVEAMFDGITGTYDGLNRLMSFSIDRSWRRRAIDLLQLKDGDRVLDVATGTGDMAILAASRCHCSLVGVDLSRRMMASASTKWVRATRGAEYLLVQGDAATLPFQDEAFDHEMVAFGARNMADLDAFLSDAYRTMKANGRLAILELSVPTLPVVRQVFLLYLTKVLPLIARAWGGDQAAYRYLSDSIITFPPPERIEEMMRSHGFHMMSSEDLTLGSCHLYVAVKESRPCPAP